MGLASISWNSVRVFSKLRTGLFRVLYDGTRFGTARRIAYAHSIVGTPDSGTSISSAVLGYARLTLFLWVALDGAAAVRKVDLTTGTVGLPFGFLPATAASTNPFR